MTGRTEYTLGRVAEGQPILPDIDLSPYDAFSYGVSRLHAALKVNKDQVAIMDLGSSNGTSVNGKKIPSSADYPLNHGDVVNLGRLKLQILIRR
ncbi:MAG: FHA domain-containing protein [Chloroflexi bacterium]|nr:FHA domain-containing protein [Chloroflexota bacterium]